MLSFDFEGLPFSIYQKSSVQWQPREEYPQRNSHDYARAKMHPRKNLDLRLENGVSDRPTSGEVTTGQLR